MCSASFRLQSLRWTWGVRDENLIICKPLLFLLICVKSMLITLAPHSGRYRIRLTPVLDPRPVVLYLDENRHLGIQQQCDRKHARQRLTTDPSKGNLSAEPYGQAYYDLRGSRTQGRCHVHLAQNASKESLRQSCWTYWLWIQRAAARLVRAIVETELGVWNVMFCISLSTRTVLPLYPG